jgi:hypothetical protein
MRVLIRLLFVAGLVALSDCTPPPALKEYAYPAWAFAASFRAPPTQTDTPAAADGTTAHTFLIESVLAGRDNLVNVIDGSNSTKSDDQALSDAPGVLATAVSGTLGPISYVATGAVVGREFLINRQGKPASRVRVFVSNKHLYEVISQSSLGPDDPETTAFLDSFRLLAPG